MRKERILSLRDEHLNFQKKFKQNYKKIPELEKNKEKLNNEFFKLNQEDPSKLGENGIKKLFDLKDKLEKIDKQILTIKKEKQNYFLKTRNLINKTHEKKANLDEFKRKLKLEPEQIHFNDLKHKYNHNITCDNCNEKMDWILYDDQYVCFNCGFVVEAFPQANEYVNSNVNDFDSEAQLFCYKKINHFNDWLDQLQARGTNIPEDVFETILLQLKKMQIQDFKKLDYETMRSILKRLKLSKYYEQIPIIINKLNNEPTIVIDIETENKLKEMFKLIQNPFYQVKPKSRRNFLSYSYVLHKLCQLLNRQDLVNCFPLLKSREKMIAQEKIWKDIVEILDWEFIPSI